MGGDRRHAAELSVGKPNPLRLAIGARELDGTVQVEVQPIRWDRRQWVPVTEGNYVYAH